MPAILHNIFFLCRGRLSIASWRRISLTLADGKTVDGKVTSTFFLPANSSFWRRTDSGGMDLRPLEIVSVCAFFYFVIGDTGAHHSAKEMRSKTLLP